MDYRFDQLLLSLSVFLYYLALTNNQVIENLERNVAINTLDVAGNRIKLIQGLETLGHLQEFWCNDNLIEDWHQLKGLTHSPVLATVYLERNPIQKDINYRRKIKLELPSLTQIDATLCQ